MVFIWVPVGVMGILLLGPIIFNAVVSLYHWVLLGNAPTFAGIGEYQQLVADPQYVQSLLRTVLFVVITVGVEMIVGFFVAYLLYRHFNRLTILQMLFLLPMMVSDVVAALAWRLILGANTSIGNWFLELVGIPAQQWFGPRWAFATISAVDIWMWTPFVVLLIFAAMQGMPHDVVEASALDGASGWQNLRYILIPLLKPAILVTLLFRTIIALRVFATVWVLTGGGPGDHTAVLGVEIYRTAFQSFDVGLSAAIGMLLLGLGIVIGTIYIRLMTRDPLY